MWPKISPVHPASDPYKFEAKVLEQSCEETRFLFRLRYHQELGNEIKQDRRLSKISYEAGLFQKSFASVTRPLVTKISQEQCQGHLSSRFCQA